MKLLTLALTFSLLSNISFADELITDPSAMAPAPSTTDDVVEKAVDEALSVDKKPSDEDAKPVKKAKPVAQAADPAAPELPPDLQPKPVKPKKAVKKKEKKIDKITTEEAEFLKSVEKSTGTSANKESTPAPVEKHKSPAYVPAPAEPQEIKHGGFVVDRDSSKVLTKRLSFTDALDVKVCFSAGLQIVLDSDIQTELQRVIIDDKIFFDAIDLDNHRGVYVRLKQPVPEGKRWESAIRLVRKDNDKAYLVNLIGVACPKETDNKTDVFPKMVYIKDKFPGITGKNTRMLTPEDTIIEFSGGLPRKNVNKMDVYDMVAKSGAEWTILALQVQLPKDEKVDPKKLPDIKVLDNLQVNEIPCKIEYMPVQSEKVTAATGVETARFKIVANIDKQYFTEQRYVYIMLVDKNGGYYQYMKVDTRDYISSLRERGFDI